MNVLTFSEDPVLFGTSILPATNHRLQFAVAARHRDNSEAENVLWEARAEGGTIEVGVDVVVISQDGMKLVVRPKRQ